MGRGHTIKCLTETNYSTHQHTLFILNTVISNHPKYFLNKSSRVFPRAIPLVLVLVYLGGLVVVVVVDRVVILALNWLATTTADSFFIMISAEYGFQSASVPADTAGHIK